MDIHTEELFKLEPDSQDRLVLVDFDSNILFVELSVIAAEAFRVMKWGGVVEFSALNFEWLARRWQYFGMDQVINDLLFDPTRTAVWDEGSVVKTLFHAGFYKIWTGHTPEIPDWCFYTKALKLNTSE